MSYFTDLGLAEPILRALETKGYSEPTPIQRQAIPALLTGRDLLGIAQTGTGKTAAFALPSLHRLAAEPTGRHNAACRMLVLSPTRELAAQIAENMRGYARYLNLSVQCVFGGVPVGKQSRALVPGCDILVATPGRLLDLIDQRALTLRHVEIFVLDEADQMMDLGFIHALKRVSALLPAKRQSLFFSATMPKAIADLGRQFINDPVRVEVTPQATTAERVLQYATYVNQSEKQALLTLRLRGGLGDGSVERALVFTRTKHGADRVVRHLAGAGVSCAAIHGNKSQGQRTAAIQGFRKGDIPVLVATDIAARGIDVPGVSHVFNFEMPNVAEQYVHRIGRTARAGADGVAVSFVAPDEKAYLRDIERLTKVQLMPQALPEDFMAQVAKLPAPLREQASEARHAPRGGDRGGPRGAHSGARGGHGGARGHDGDARRPQLHRSAAGDSRPDHPRGERRPDDRRAAPAEGQHPRHSERRPDDRNEHRAGDRRPAAPRDGKPAAPRRDGPTGGQRRDGAPGAQRRDGQGGYAGQRAGAGQHRGPRPARG